MKAFDLVRITDKSGVSGIGIIAQGVEFDDGQVIINWTTQFKSLGIYRSMEDMIAIHGHGGATYIKFRKVDLPQTNED